MWVSTWDLDDQLQSINVQHRYALWTPLPLLTFRLDLNQNQLGVNAL